VAGVAAADGVGVAGIVEAGSVAAGGVASVVGAASAAVGGPHLRTRTLAVGPGVAMLDVVCTAPHGGWSAPERGDRWRLVFPRRGVFVRRVAGQEMVIDPGLAYFAWPDVPQQVAHPCAGGDACTTIVLDEAALVQVAGTLQRLPDGPLPTDGRLDFAQRTLVARLRSGRLCGAEATEQVLRLVAQVLERGARGPQAATADLGSRPATARARRRLVDVARTLLASESRSLRLGPLARRLGVSPSYLSRVFHAETGQTLAGHRSRVRVRLALERLAAGERDLAALAAELGFADQAHLTRAVRREVGHPPGHVRRLLAAAEVGV
jgi:AraC-like DNA-binding protein